MVHRGLHAAATVTILAEFSEVVLFGGKYSKEIILNETQIGRFGKVVVTWEILIT